MSLNFSVVIPNLNGAAYLDESLPSLLKAINLCPSSKFEIILVDNASTDNSFDILNKYFLESKIIILKKNYGFAYAVNRGIEAAKYDYVCLMNNDLSLDPLWFKKITATIKKDSTPVCFSGTVLNKEGTHYESQGLDFHYSGECHNLRNGEPYLEIALRSKSSWGNNLKIGNSLIWGSSAALVVYQKDIIKKIGLFDEDFFAYEEDVDVALRLHLLGYQTLLIPTAISYHLGGGTSRRMGNFRHRMDLKNWIYIIIKNFTGTEIIKNFFPIIEQRLRNLSGLIKNTPSISVLPTVLSVFYEVAVHLPSMFKKRHQFQKLLKSKL